MVYRRNKLLALVHKEEDWSGLVVPIPVVYGNPQGASADFATAQANVTASKVTRFVMNWVQDYAVAKITNLVQLASRNDAGAFLKAVRQEIDGTLGSGAIGYVIAVSRSAGTFTVSTTATGSAGTPSGWTGTMYYRVSGDLNLKLNGLTDWLPSSDPTSASFNGVDRSVDPTRLGGVRWDGSSQPIEEAVIDAAALCAREDGNPELGITNHTTWAGLVKALGSKVQYVNFESDEVPEVGFQGVRVNGPDGEINIFADRSCQAKTMYLLDPDSWTLGSMKACPHILSELDGLVQLRSATTDSAEVRIGSYAIFATNAPGRNARITTQV